jgi:tetratricopeptide (TPR) repeat protein
MRPLDLVSVTTLRALSLPTLCLLSCLSLPFTVAFAASDYAAQIEALEPMIGGYPPNVKDDAELKTVKKAYADLKASLDKDLKARPSDLALLYQRGRLQTMGHNLDLNGAFEGAEKDLQKVIKAEPTHVPALVALGSMWVNANPVLAPKAEALFRAAQCASGAEPLEDAQRGLYFAYYYQGRTKDAFRQIGFLKQHWPDNPTYAKLFEVTLGVLKRGETGDIEAALPPAMTTCKA